MFAFKITQSSNVFFTGLVGGVLFGDRMGTSPVRPTLPAGCFVQFQQGLHVHFVPLMPILLFLAVASGLVTAVLARRRSRTSFIYAAGAAMLSLAVLVITLAINVPINVQLMTWTPASPPPDLPRLWAPWEQAHTIRTVLALAAFLVALLAQVVRPEGPPKTAGAAATSFDNPRRAFLS
jgi:uncharacterized membrane protein